MRSKIAVALAILGLLLLVLGIGQRTWWLPAENVSAASPQDAKAAPVTVIDSKTRDLRSGPVTVTVKSSGNFVIAAGRSDDVAAWVGKAAHNTIGGASGDFKSLQETYTAGEAKVPNPAGADIWEHDQSATGELQYRWTPPANGDWSLLVASDGTAPAPTDISVTWPNDDSTPWAVPLIVVGALLLLAGVALYLLGRGTFGGRNNRGTGARAATSPRRGPETAGRNDAGINSFHALAAAKLRRRPGRALAVVLGAVVLAVPAAGAQAATSPAPSPSGSASATPAAEAPVVTDSQLKRILEQVAAAVGKADAAKDANQLKARVDGTALENRTANYKIRSQVGGYQAPAPVSATKLLTSVVSTKRDWPRSVMAVTQGADNPVPQLFTLQQASPRENYRLVAASPLLPGMTFPNANREGAGVLAAGDQADLQDSGKQVLDGLGDRLTSAGSSWKDRFADNPYVKDVLSYQDDLIKGTPNGNLTFSHKQVAKDTVVFRTADGGALVVGHLVFGIDGTPKNPGDKLVVNDDAAALAGGKESDKGMQLTFGESVVVYVPPASSKDKIQVVGATRGLTGAKFK